MKKLIKKILLVFCILFCSVNNVVYAKHIVLDVPKEIKSHYDAVAAGIYTYKLDDPWAKIVVYIKIFNHYKAYKEPKPYDRMFSALGKIVYAYVDLEHFDEITLKIKGMHALFPEKYIVYMKFFSNLIALQQGKYTKVLSYANEDVKDSQDGIYKNRIKVIVLLLSNQLYKEMLASAEYLIENFKMFGYDYYLEKGIALYKLKDYQKSIEFFGKYLKRNGNTSSLPYYYRAFSFYSLGDFDKAKDDIEKARKINKVDFIELSTRNNMKFKYSVEQEAAIIEEKLVAKGYTFSPFKSITKEELENFNPYPYEKPTISFRPTDEEMITAYYKKINSLKKQKPIHYQDISDIYSIMVLRYLRMEDYDSLEGVTKRFRNDLPKEYHHLATKFEMQMLLYKGKYKELLTVVNAEIKRNPSLEYCYRIQAAAMYFSKADDETTLIAINRAIKTPGPFYIFIYKGYVLIKLKRYKEAIKAFDVFLGAGKLAKSIKSSYVYYGKAICYYHQSFFNKALKNIKRGKNLNNFSLPDLSSFGEQEHKAYIENMIMEIQKDIKAKKNDMVQLDEKQDHGQLLLALVNK